MIHAIWFLLVVILFLLWIINRQGEKLDAIYSISSVYFNERKMIEITTIIKQPTPKGDK